MPNGKTHEKASMTMAWGVSTVLLGLGTPVPDVAALAVGLLSTRWLSADLDLRFSSPSRRWGPLKIIWWPYQAAIKHRSKTSHSALLSTLVRVAYLVLLCFLSWAITVVIAFTLIGTPPFFKWPSKPPPSKLGGIPSGMIVLGAAAPKPPLWPFLPPASWGASWLP